MVSKKRTKRPKGGERQLHMRRLVDSLWPIEEINRDWDSEDIDFVGQYVEGDRRSRGSHPAQIAYTQIIDIIRSSDEWDSDMLQDVSEIANAYWKQHPELVGRRFPTGPEFNGWLPQFANREEAKAYFALGTVGNQEYKMPNPGGGGLLKGLATAALAGVGIAGVALGERERRKSK